MHFLPHFPLNINPVALFGLTLLLGLIGGELAQRSYFLPKISGYLAVGFLVGPTVFNIVTPPLLANAHIFVDISLGLILFDLGRHLDITWLRHDPGIIYMSIAESALTFIFVMMILLFFHLPVLHAALTATIVIATSPAVIMMVADDLKAHGPVTRRTFILTSLNNMFALILFTLLLPIASSSSLTQLVGYAAYRLAGSVMLGMVIFAITLAIAKWVGKHRMTQFILFVASVVFAIGVSDMLKLSSMLVLFTLGIAARNLNVQSLLTEVDFGWLAKLFFILLFVVIGIHMQLKGIWESSLMVFSILLMRTLAKSLGIWLFAKSSRLTRQQTWALCFSLMPMAGVAVGMSYTIFDFNPAIGYPLMTVLTTVIAVLNILGPIATQLAFVKSDETIIHPRQ